LLHRARPRIRDAGMLGEKGHYIGLDGFLYGLLKT